MKFLVQFLQRHFRVLFIYLPLLFTLITGIYIFFIFVQWRQQRDGILNQLKQYKRFIDYTEDLQDGFKFGGYFSTGVQGTAIGIPSKIYDRNGIVIGEFFAEKRDVIPLKKIPKTIIASVIANEDADFMEHNGINPKGILRAFAINLITFSYRQGGSTLTQQLAKVLFTEGKKTIKRKIFEAFCALEIEDNYDKRDILAMYLNLIYFGKGAFGIEEASRTYFNKSAGSLTLGESAMLVGIIPNPAYFNPLRNIRRALHRTRLVLHRLVEIGAINERQEKKALRDLVDKWDIRIVQSHPNGGISLIGKFSQDNFRVNKAPHFNERLRRILIKHFDEQTLKQNGLKIYTTLDINKQLIAEKVIKRVILRQRKYHEKMAKLYQRKNRHALAREELEKAKNINGALVAINPYSGEIESYVAGYEFSSKNQLDRVEQIQRQPGSSFKPFVYASAIEQKKITIASILEDKKIRIGNYSPKNYDNKYIGKVNARDALRKSINTVAVQVLDLANFSRLYEILGKALELDSSEVKKRFPRNLSLALGSAELSPLEHVRLHAMFSNGGQFLIPYGLRYVEDYGGKTILDNEKNIQERIRRKRDNDEMQIISPQTAYIMTRMLEAFFEPGVYGYNWKKKVSLPFDIGGKTGTSSNYVDVWFAGHTPRLVSSLWMGNDAGNISLGPGRSGGSLMAPSWFQYINAIKPFMREARYKKPNEGIVLENVCEISGQVPRSPESCEHALLNQPFLEGTEPGDYCPLHP